MWGWLDVHRRFTSFLWLWIELNQAILTGIRWVLSPLSARRPSYLGSTVKSMPTVIVIWFVYKPLVSVISGTARLAKHPLHILISSFVRRRPQNRTCRLAEVFCPPTSVTFSWFLTTKLDSTKTSEKAHNSISRHSVGIFWQAMLVMTIININTVFYLNCLTRQV